MSYKPVRATNVAAKKVEWLWRERIPKGMITVIAGRPDQGKGLFAAHIAADASRRGIKVLFSAAEDDFGRMTKPRLEAAGADLSNILLWRFQLPAQMDELEAIVRDEGIGLIIMDPLNAHLGGSVSRHNDSIRSVTQPLTALVEDTGAALLVVEHVNKRFGGGSALSAIGGSSSGIVAASRAAYLFGVDPDDDDQRVLVVAKCNLRDKPKAILFETDVMEHPEVGDVPALDCKGEIEFDAVRLLENRKENRKGRPDDKRADAAEWLTMYLVAAGGPVKGSTVIEDAKQNGMSVKTLRRAAEDMEIVKQPASGPNCMWDLPTALRAQFSDVAQPAETETLDWDSLERDLLGGDDA